MTWKEITTSDDYKSLPDDLRSDIKRTYFDSNIAPGLAGATREDVALAFQDWMETPDDTGEGLIRSALGSAARGFFDPLAAAPEVAGAYLGIEGLEEFGGDVRGAIEGAFPVNPAEQGLVTDVAGVLGQVGQIVATGGGGAVAGAKLLGKGATEAAKRQAMKFGATAAQQTAMGSSAVAGGLERAEQLGLEGGDRLLRGAIAGGTELLAERLGGFATELGPINKFMGQSAEEAWFKPIIRGIGTEALEEGGAEAAGQATDIAMAPEAAPGMDLKNIGYAMLLGGVGGAAFGGIEAAITPRTKKAFEFTEDFTPSTTPPPGMTRQEADDQDLLVYDNVGNVIGYKTPQAPVTAETIEAELPVEIAPTVAPLAQNVAATPEASATAAALQRSAEELRAAETNLEQAEDEGILMDVFADERAKAVQREDAEAAALREAGMRMLTGQQIPTETIPAQAETVTPAPVAEEIITEQEDQATLEQQQPTETNVPITQETLQQEQSRGQELQEPRQLPILPAEQAAQAPEATVGAETAELEQQKETLPVDGEGAMLQGGGMRVEEKRKRDYATGDENTPFYFEDDSWKVDKDRIPSGSEVIETSDGPAVYLRRDDGVVVAYGVTANGRHTYIGESNNSFLPSEYSNVPINEMLDALKGARTYESDMAGDLFSAIDQETAERLVRGYPPDKPQVSSAPTDAVPTESLPATGQLTPRGVGVAGESEEVAELEGLMLAKIQSENNVRGVKFTKRNQARLQKLFSKYRDKFVRSVNPDTDELIGQNDRGENIYWSNDAGTYYAMVNGRVQTAPWTAGLPDSAGDRLIELSEAAYQDATPPPQAQPQPATPATQETKPQAAALTTQPATQESTAAQPAAGETGDAGVARDPSKREQMTPDEFVSGYSYEIALARSERDFSGKSGKALRKEGKDAYDNRTKPLLQKQHKDAIISAVGLDTELNSKFQEFGMQPPRDPVSAEAVDSYGITLPQGYVKQGDLYIFKPEATGETPVQAAPPAAQAVDATASGPFQRLSDYISTLSPKAQAAWTPERLSAAESYYATGNESALEPLTATQRKIVMREGVSESDAAAYEAEQKRQFALRNPPAATDSQFLEDYNAYVNSLSDETLQKERESREEAPGVDDARYSKQQGDDKVVELEFSELPQEFDIPGDPVALAELRELARDASSKIGKSIGVFDLANILENMVKYGTAERFGIQAKDAERARQLNDSARGKTEGPPDDDGFFYHVTTKRNAKAILKSGAIQPGKQAQFQTAATQANSQGRVFVSNLSGVNFWRDRIQEQLDDRESREKLVVLRIPKSLVVDPQIDNALETRSDSFYTTSQIPTNSGTQTRYKKILRSADGNIRRTGVKSTPARAARNSYIGVIPGVENTWLGTTEDFDAEFPDGYPFDSKNNTPPADTEALVAEDGRAFIFIDRVQVLDGDAERAEQHGTSPGVEAIKRLLRHESFVHRGFMSLPGPLKARFADFVASGVIPEAELDYLVNNGYPQYKGWRDNKTTEMLAAEEWLAQRVERMGRIPQSGPIASIMDWLRDVWRWLTGGETTDLDKLRDTMRAMHKALGALDPKQRIVMELPDMEMLRRSYIGERAIENMPEERKQFMRDSLDTAKAMAAAGKSSEEIRAVTGWFPGKYDGKMRWELPDDGASLRLDDFRTKRNDGDSQRDIAVSFFNEKWQSEMNEAMKAVAGMPKDELLAYSRNFQKRQAKEKEALAMFYMAGDNKDRGRVPLGYILNHDALFEAYPELRWIPVSFNAEDVQMDAAGQINPDGSIGLNPMVSFSDPSSAISTILHEIQHITQVVEGFAKGSSVDAAARRQGWNPSDIDWKQAYKDYERAAGEIEARDIQARQRLTPAQRAATAPYSSENIAPEDAIVMFGGSGSQASTSSDIRYSKVQRPPISAQVPALTTDNIGETSQENKLAMEAMRDGVEGLPLKYRKMADDGKATEALEKYAVDMVKPYTESREKMLELLEIMRDGKRISEVFDIDALKGQASLGYIFGEAALQAERMGDRVLADEFSYSFKGVGTAGGQALAVRRLFLESPRYQTLKAVTMIDSVARGDQQAVVNAKVGKPTAAKVGAEFEGATETARDTTAEAIESEAQISEKVLELGAAVQGNPTLTERVKKLISNVIDRGRKIRALQKLKSQTRASIIPDSGDFENMSEAELEAEIARLTKEIEADMDFIEKEVAKTPRTQAPKTPVETAKAIINRVQKQAAGETTRAKPKLDRVRILYKAHLRERMAEADFMDEAKAAGLTPQVAQELYDAAELEIAAILLSKEVRGKSENYDKLTRERLKHLDVDSSALVEYINRLRREGKLGPVNWRDIMQLPPTRQQVIKGTLLELVKQNPQLQNLSAEEQQTLADALEKVWERERERQFKLQVKRLEMPGAKQEDQEKVVSATPRIIKLINQGMLAEDAFYKAVGEQFGIKEMSDADRKRIIELSEFIQDEAIPEADKAKEVRELVTLLQKYHKLTTAEILSNVWVAHVLSGVRTQTDMALGFLNGLLNTVKKAGLVIYKNPNAKGAKTAAKGIQQFFVGLADGMAEAARYVRTEEPGLVRSDIEFINSYFEGGLKKGGLSTARKLRESDNKFLSALGSWLAILERVNTGWDVINYRATYQGTLAMAHALNPKIYKEALMPTTADFKAMEERAKTMLGANATRAQIKSRAFQYIEDGVHLLGKNLDESFMQEWKQMATEFNYDAKEAAMMVDPTGIGGLFYRGIMGLTEKAETKAKARADKAKEELLDPTLGRDQRFIRQVFPPLMYLLASQARNIFGFRFVRFTGNKINELISYIPIVGMARIYLEEGMYRNNELTLKAMSVQMNQLIATAIMIPALIKAMYDLEDDDEERGYIIQGPWDNLTPERKSQLMADGFKPNTIAFYDKKTGRWTSYNYINWPSAGWFATAGSVSDYRRYTPEKWDEKTAAAKFMSGIYAGGSSFLDISSISQMTELFGRSTYSTDPATKGLEKVTKLATGYAGGFVPRIAKDVDSWFDKTVYKPEDTWGHIAKEMPFYRRGVGKQLRDIFYEPVEISRTPWSRALQVSPDDPAYKALGRLNSRGIWLTPANPENRKVKRGGKLRDMTDEEANAYMAEVGKRYKEFVMKQGDRLLEMDVDRADELVSKYTARIREIAFKRAIATAGKAAIPSPE